MDVSVGFDGVVMNQSWAPVLVELFNDGPPVEGVIKVRASPKSRGIEYAKPVTLPTNSRKRLWLYPHVGNYDSSYEVRLISASGRVMSETVTPFQTVANAILVASATWSDLKLFPSSAKADDTTTLYSARMRQVALPDDAAGYEGLNALVLTDVTESEWTVGQRRALRDWVALGGRLIVSVHNADNFTKSRFWEELLPMRITGSEVVPNLNSLGLPSNSSTNTATPVAVGEVTRGTARFTAGEKPLVIESEFGRGRVTLLTFSIEREPFRSARGKEEFWRGLAVLPALAAADTPAKNKQHQQQMQMFGAQTLDDVFRALLEQRLERQISVWWLLLLIGAYLVVIGPFDYWLVRHKLRKPVLTWVTFPCYVVGFSALIYGIGWSLKSGDSELIELSFVDIVPDANLARGTTIAGFYSTSNRRFPFAGTSPQSHFRLASSGMEDPSSPGVFSGDTQVIEADTGFQANVPVPIWSSKMFVTEWIEPDSLLSATVKGRVVQLQNRTASNLEHVTLFTGTKVYELRELAGNGTVEANLATLAPSRDFQRWLESHTDPALTRIMEFWRIPFYRHREKTLPPWDNVLFLSTFAERMRALTPGRPARQWRAVDLSGSLTDGNLIVLAYAKNPVVGGVHAKFKPDHIEHHALLRCVVKL
jgi:hypothetical protein